MDIPEWLKKELSAEIPLDRMPRYCGIPATEFTKEQLVRILASAMQERDREVELHRRTLSILR